MKKYLVNFTIYNKQYCALVVAKTKIQAENIVKKSLIITGSFKISLNDIIEDYTKKP